MEKIDIENLKSKVRCPAVLEQAGFALDRKESTAGAMKFRRGDDIIIVIHAGLGWFDPLSDAKGDVFNLVGYLERAGFRKALSRVADLVGYEPTLPSWPQRAFRADRSASIDARWRRRRTPISGSSTWRYLLDARHLPESVIHAALGQDRLREGPRGSMWAAHTDNNGRITGWEERGREWRGFARGGAKVLFRLGPNEALRLCVTEAAIDAMSLAALENGRDDTLYLSTGGGWAPATTSAIHTLATRARARLVIATDNNRQGHVYAARLAAMAAEIGCTFSRLCPEADDWNEDLRFSNATRRPDSSRPGGCRTQSSFAARKEAANVLV